MHHLGVARPEFYARHVPSDVDRKRNHKYAEDVDSLGRRVTHSGRDRSGCPSRSPLSTVAAKRDRADLLDCSPVDPSLDHRDLSCSQLMLLQVAAVASSPSTAAWKRLVTAAICRACRLTAGYAGG
jgi:hypothetical protein